LAAIIGPNLITQQRTRLAADFNAALGEGAQVTALTATLRERQSLL
jgi:hypothetical protein